MRTVRALMATLVLAVLIPLTASAQDSSEVTVTMKLTLNGDVPWQDQFSVVVSGEGLTPVTIPICGPLVEDAKCESDFTGYRETYLAQAVPLNLAFERRNIDTSEVEVFNRRNEVFFHPTTLDVSYTYASSASSLLFDLALTLAGAAILGLLPAYIARRKGREFGKWWLYGFLIWIIALPHSLLIKSDKAVV